MRLFRGLFARSKVNFISEVSPECTRDLCNPDRGWYRIFPFVIGNAIDWKNLKYSVSDGERLVLIRIDIGNYSEAKLNDEALSEIRKIINFFCELDKDIILRFTYDSEGEAMVREPSLYSTVSAHMEQLSKLVNEYGDRIFIFQGLLIGNWGEMHSSRYVSEKYIRGLYQKAPDKCFVTVRTPKIHRLLAGDDNNRLGLFDDAIFASENDLGTYTNSDDADYESMIGIKAPNGGEAVFGEGYSDKLTSDEILASMTKRHVSYLNIQHDKRILDRWKCDNKLYKEICEKLGYRFVVKSAHLDRKKECLVVLIQNVGFAPIYRQTETTIIIVNSDDETIELPTEIDLRKQDTDTGIITSEIYFENDLNNLKGKVYLRTRRSYDGCRILYANSVCKDGDVYLGILA